MFSLSLSLSLSLPVSLPLLLSPPHSPSPCLPGGLLTEPLRPVSLLIQLSFLCLPPLSSTSPVYHSAGTSNRYGTVKPAGSRWLTSQLMTISSPFSRLISHPVSPPFATARLVGWRWKVLIGRVGNGAETLRAVPLVAAAAVGFGGGK